jgi:opacity protein-like surface antigen
VVRAVLVCGCTGLAAGRAADGYYVEFFGGAHRLAGGDLTQAGTTGRGSYDAGSLLGGAIGRTFSPRWAAEAEFFYRTNDLRRIDGGRLAGGTAGDFASTNLMFNATYSFVGDNGTSPWGAFTPYVGAGLGFLQEVDIDVTLAGREQEYDRNWRFAAQAIAGVSYALKGPWALFGEMRYHHAGKVALEASGPQPEIEGAYNGFSVLCGVRYRF